MKYLRAIIDNIFQTSLDQTLSRGQMLSDHCEIHRWPSCFAGIATIAEYTNQGYPYHQPPKYRNIIETMEVRGQTMPE